MGKGLIWTFIYLVTAAFLIFLMTLMMGDFNLPHLERLSLSVPYPLFKDYSRMEESVNNDVRPKIRLLCWVLTNPKTQGTKSVQIKETWGKRCDKLIFMSTVEDLELGAINLNVKEGRNNIWGKTRMAHKYLYDNLLNDYDWFLKTDDDTYIIVENLRYMLYSYDPEFPISFGMNYHRSGKRSYLTGGAGFVLSRAAVRKFGEVAYPNSTICRSTLGGSNEDVEMGRCMTNSGIKLGDSRDAIGQGRFFQHSTEYYIDGGHIHAYPRTTKYKIAKGLEGLSEIAISFHKLKEESKLYVIEFLIYKLQVFGLNRDYNGPVYCPLPPDIDAIPEQVLERFGHPLLDRQDTSQHNVTEADGLNPLK